MSDDDDFIEEDEPTVLIEFEQEITMVRLIDSAFLPSKIKLSAELIPTHDLEEDQFDVAVTKMRFWLEGIASRCIAFARGNPHAHKMLIDDEGRNNSSNLLMLTPYEPSDEHMAALFQSKFTALGGGDLIVGSVEVRSNNMAGLVFRFVGNAEEILPDMETWIGERSFFDTPWWGRDDASTLDVIPADDADLEKKPAWAYSLDFLSAVGKEQPDVVLRPEFKPTVIDGGQKDD